MHEEEEKKKKKQTNLCHEPLDDTVEGWPLVA